ncbi:CvpA family protein [Jejudonia soesokkakensis]|uniref:CvpA family protein n=1 Tax=Jejudonia soesokkakensis TaxID=1323432 RepID=A0ABW2MME6_9FLAO
MGAIDIVLGIILLLGLFSGWKQGLFVALASLIGLIFGVYGAIYFSDYTAQYISEWTDLSEQTTNLIAFAVTFLIIIIIISLLGKFLTKIADFAALGMINKLLGAAFTALKYAFIVSVLFMFINSSEGLSGYIVSEEKKEDSVLYQPVASLAPMLLPTILNEYEKYNSESEHINETQKASE